jgi:uncharacterized protein (DUF2235 family)
MPKRLVVCCDGTWNTPDDVKGGVRTPTNVTKLALGVAPVDPATDTPQITFYHRGVGTGRWERLRGGAFGFGLSRNICQAYRFLVQHYEPGDQLFFFGFSRGAYTARSTVGLVRNSGILRRQHIDRIGEAYALYRERGRHRHPTSIEAQLFRRTYAHEPRIHFIGVWDTVGALGIPLSGLRLVHRFNRRWQFHDTTLSSHVDNAFHALAIDEKRGAFTPTLWDQQPNAGGQRLEQVWFAGVHSDVGGGYRDPSLSEIPLLWMVERARECGLAFQPAYFEPLPPDADPTLRPRGRYVKPDVFGIIHESRQGFYKLLPARPRALDDPTGANQSLASSADERYRKGGYDPPGLGDYIRTGARITKL